MEIKPGRDYVGVSVVYFCHDGQGNFVMAKRSENTRDEHNRWDIGGGRLEFGDRVEETLVREIKEEYCTDVLKSEFLGFRDVHRGNEAGQTHWVALDFKVLVEKDKVKNGEPHKFSEVKWFTLAPFLERLPADSQEQIGSRCSPLNGVSAPAVKVPGFTLDTMPPDEPLHSQMPLFIEKYRSKLQ